MAVKREGKELVSRRESGGSKARERTKAKRLCLALKSTMESVSEVEAAADKLAAEPV